MNEEAILNRQFLIKNRGREVDQNIGQPYVRISSQERKSEESKKFEDKKVATICSGAQRGE